MVKGAYLNILKFLSLSTRENYGGDGPFKIFFPKKEYWRITTFCLLADLTLKNFKKRR